jgi:hypothetical protein
MGATVQVFDIAGRLVENLQIPEGEESLMVDVSTYPPGIYVLHWKGVNGTAENRRLAVLR